MVSFVTTKKQPCVSKNYTIKTNIKIPKQNKTGVYQHHSNLLEHTPHISSCAALKVLVRFDAYRLVFRLDCESFFVILFCSIIYVHLLTID